MNFLWETSLENNRLYSGITKYHNIKYVKNVNDECLVVSNGGEVCILSLDGKTEHGRYKIPYAACLRVSDSEKINLGDVIATWDPYNSYIICESSGIVEFKDILINVSWKRIS